MPRAIANYRPPRPPASSGSKPFLLHTDLGMCWCKALNNPQGPMVPVNEQICASLGRLVGIGVCEAWIVEIPAALAGDVIEPGYVLQAGYAHGSAEVSGALEVRGALANRSEDENAVRHAGFFALHDWLWGQDEQWLRSAPEQNRYYAHDQGHFLPGGPNWTVQTLQAARESPHPMSHDVTGLNSPELSRLADALEALTSEDIRGALPNFPASWPIDGPALAAVVDFATHRAPTVAGRLRALA
jgi:hypothetical protein